jgi:hypothetical protein
MFAQSACSKNKGRYSTGLLVLRQDKASLFSSFLIIPPEDTRTKVASA